MAFQNTLDRDQIRDWKRDRDTSEERFQIKTAIGHWAESERGGATLARAPSLSLSLSLSTQVSATLALDQTCDRRHAPRQTSTLARLRRVSLPTRTKWLSLFLSPMRGGEEEEEKKKEGACAFREERETESFF